MESPYSIFAPRHSVLRAPCSCTRQELIRTSTPRSAGLVLQKTTLIYTLSEWFLIVFYSGVSQQFSSYFIRVVIRVNSNQLSALQFSQLIPSTAICSRTLKSSISPRAGAGRSGFYQLSWYRRFILRWSQWSLHLPVSGKRSGADCPRG